MLYGTVYMHTVLCMCCLLSATMFKSLHVLWQHFTTDVLLTTSLLGAQLLRYFSCLVALHTHTFYFEHCCYY